MESKVNPLEKKVIFVALLVSAVHLALIAYAAVGLNISVPDCVTDREVFTQADFIKHSERRFEVHLIAKMWAFEPHTIRLPVGSTLDIFATSMDVTHGIHIAGTNVNVMAVPSVVSQAQVQFDRPGKYSLVCHEYCGVGHQEMLGVIEIDPTITEPEVIGLAPGSSASSLDLAQFDKYPGKKVLEAKACIACHSLDGSAMVGPTFLNIWGRREEMADGTFITVDEEYIREAISDPQKKVVKGYQVPMPMMPLTQDELNEVIELLKVLKD